MAKELIFIADDFGMNNEINEAVLYAHLSGHLTGAALMMAQPATGDAVAQARAHPTLQIGWHLHLNDSVPATASRWPWGASPVRAGFSIGLSRRARELMRREVARQWELFQETGLPCRFINSHHHLHAHPLVYRALLDVVGPQFQGWIRLGRPRAFRSARLSFLWSALERIYLGKRRRLSAWRSTDTLWGLDRIFRMDAGEIEAALTTLPDGFHEFLFHPRSRSCPDTLCLIQLKSSPARS
ncbi:MAG: ChbG/HpnK family deacetylase [Methylacidiphilales bacterium]|nr:ChbG/HpnK family deacetylase [Candidatus Methylacidiphilales bacterium]